MEFKEILFHDQKGDSLKGPAANASLYSSYVSQSWMNDIFKKGYKEPLEESDIHEVLERDSSYHLQNRLKRLWEQEVRASHNPRLLWPVMSLVGIRYFSCIILMIVEVGTRLMQSIYIGKIVAHFQAIEKEKSSGYLSACILVFFAIIECISRHAMYAELFRSGMDTRVALTGLIYRKMLCLSQASLGFTSIGQIVNVITNDVNKTEEAVKFSLYLIPTPFILIVASYLCWREIGFSFLPGMLLLLILPIFQSWYGRFFAILRAKTATLRDKRIKLMNEVICGMRAIKMYAWEHRFAERIHQLRRLECMKLLSTTRLNALNASFYMTTIPLVSLAMFVSYALSGNTLTTEKVFTVVALVSSVSTIFSKIVPRGITLLKESGVSLKRIKDFLLLDEESSLSSEPCDDVNAYVVVDHLHASWKKESTEEVCSNITFTTTVGELLMIIGPVGCGKSSLLLAMLREIPLVSGNVQMAGRVAYVSQQPWVFSGSIKENITFGKDFDQEKYDEVVRVCALKKDIDSFVKGDETLVGDRGINLSGGQKSRINLARAVYLDADIYLIDDPLSAVDPHVARHIFDECIRGTLIPKVCILVSHQLQFLDAADRILCMEKGQTVGYDSFENLNKAGIDFASSLTKVEKSIQVNGSSTNDKSSEKLQQLSTISNADKKTRKVMNTLSCNDISESLLPAECAKDQVKSTPDVRHEVTCAPTHTVQFDSTNDQSDEEEEKDLPSSHDNIHVERRITGRVTSKSYKDYFTAGAQPAILVLCLILFLIGQASSIISDWWLAKWSNWEETVSRRNNSLSIIDDSRTENILIYSATVLICFVFSFLRAVVWFQILINASQHLHDRMFRGVIRAPIYFYDTNPVGRVLNRFSKDIGVIDDTLPMVFFDAFQLGVLGISILLISVVSQPYVIVAVAPVIGAFIWLRQYFVKSSREIKRLEAISRSPFYSHFTASLQGLPIIRASCEQNQYIELFDSYQDRNTAANYYYLSAIRWLGYRLDILCSSLIAVVAFAPFIAYEAGIGIDPVLVGLSLLYIKRLIGMFQFCVRQTAEVENQMVSVERALEYTQITPEARLSVMKEKSSTIWPPFGEIIGENVFFRYHESFPPVIKNLTFRIKAKEKIGIVGRTGAGKSSLISALFRLAEPDGVLIIDGVTITDIGLHDLREKISVIPQDPVLFSGSIRNNLDPFNKYEDVKIWDALEQVQLKHVVDNFPEKIHYDLSEYGNNLSVGQRQLLCLARAILKKNKILVVDEATANVDEKTDTLIQKTIRVRFKDCTVLTVAHRLNTIMDADKVMVLESGRMVEYGEPHALLQQENSKFSLMVAQTGITTSQTLKEIARTAHKKRSGYVSECD